MRRLHIPGMARALVEGNRIAYQRGFSRAKPKSCPITTRKPFFIGSLIRSFTALVVIQLIAVRQVELDALVQRYLTWFRVAGASVSAQLTMCHLLNQTAGIPMFVGLTNLVKFDDHPDATEQQARNLFTLKLRTPIGKSFKDNNNNYNLLGLIIEVASGDTYTDYIQSHIFHPLGMI